jgi:hypothetical protein
MSGATVALVANIFSMFFWVFIRFFFSLFILKSWVILKFWNESNDNTLYVFFFSS